MNLVWDIAIGYLKYHMHILTMWAISNSVDFQENTLTHMDKIMSTDRQQQEGQMNTHASETLFVEGLKVIEQGNQNTIWHSCLCFIFFSFLSSS